MTSAGGVPQDEPESEDALTILDPDRCVCAFYCTNQAMVYGLCDRCYMEYAAYTNTYRTSDEWGSL